MDKSSGRIEATGNKAAEAIERWKAGIACLALLAAVGVASFIVAAVPMMGAAALFNAPDLASVTNIACVAALTVFPWLLTSKGLAKPLVSILSVGRH